MNRANLLLVTAFLEMGAGVPLLFVPAVPLALLLGVGEAASEALLIARITGAALVGIGVASGWTRADEPNDSQFGLLLGILIYDGAAAVLLVYANLGLGMRGMALWPAVVVHAALALWCCLSLRVRTPGPGKNIEV